MATYNPNSKPVYKSEIVSGPKVNAKAPKSWATPTGATPPPPKTAAPAPRAPQQVAQARPFDATYQRTVDLAGRQYSDTLARLDFQRQQLDKTYGFGDLTDPFSRAALLQREYQQAQRRMLNSAGNNLYSSAQLRNEAEGRFRYEQGYDALSKEYQAALAGIDVQRAEAGFAYEGAKLNAEEEAVARALANRATDPGPPAPKHANNPQAIAWVQAEAQRLWKLGRKTGKAWRPIIDFLGYDPRQGGTLKFR